MDYCEENGHVIDKIEKASVTLIKIVMSMEKNKKNTTKIKDIKLDKMMEMRYAKKYCELILLCSQEIKEKKQKNKINVQKNIKFRADTVIYWFLDGRVLCLYDILTKTLKYNGFRELINAGIFKIKNKIYIAGGNTCEKPERNKTKVLNITQDLSITIQKLSHMVYAKTKNALVNGAQNYIYSIGGQDMKGMLSICERYDIKNNSWNLINPLNMPKSDAIVFSQSERFIYCSGGKSCSLNTFIEKYDILCDSNWEIIEISENLDYYLGYLKPKSLFKKNDNEFIIFEYDAFCVFNIRKNSYEITRTGGWNEQSPQGTRGEFEKFIKLSSTAYYKGKIYILYSSGYFKLFQYNVNNLKLENTDYFS